MKINIIIPTLNELNNIEIVLNSLISILNQSEYKDAYKICIVDDDSKDGSSELLFDLKERYNDIFDYLIRKDKKGLSSAIIDGFNTFPADYYIVTDADIQYDLNVIPSMISMAIDEGKEVLQLANRILENDNSKWKKTLKYKVSRIGYNIIKFLIKKDLPEDILSGFFLINHNLYKNVKNDLSLVGFKISIRLFFSSKVRFSYGEIYSEFKLRKIGESKK